MLGFETAGAGSNIVCFDIKADYCYQVAGLPDADANKQAADNARELSRSCINRSMLTIHTHIHGCAEPTISCSTAVRLFYVEDPIRPTFALRSDTCPPSRSYIAFFPSLTCDLLPCVVAHHGDHICGLEWRMDSLPKYVRGASLCADKNLQLLVLLIITGTSGLSRQRFLLLFAISGALGFCTQRFRH